MKAGTLLDAVLFQLTPTRTRYDLLIIANGKTEKIASGLLDPFLAHLKTAEDQIAKGGYSIRLEPDPGTDTAWFTKDTVQRFVRYVSTPEVLDRVNTLESEILQINEAFAIQGTDHLCSSIVEDHQGRWSGSIYGRKYSYSADKEKAMVLTKYGQLRRLSSGSTTIEMNSRRHLLRVLESRKNVLRKEQGMAFARAVAAGFDMDHMTNLILFAKSFGASRLLEACSRFVHLWNATHKNAQWLEVAHADTGKASDIMFSGDHWKLKQSTDTWLVSKDDLATESNEKNDYTAASNMISQQLNSHNAEDKRPTSDSQALFGPQYYHGQIENHMIPHWVTHCPPVSQSYPMQVMPYYHSYPTNYMDNKICNAESNSLEMDFSNAMSQVEVDQYQIKSRQKKTRKKAGHSGESASQSEEEIQNLHSNSIFRSPSRSKNDNEAAGLMTTSNVSDNDRIPHAQEGDAENWQTFQKLLLRIQSENNSNAVNNSNEEPQQRKRLYGTQEDPSVPPARDSYRPLNPNFENGSQNAATDLHKSSLYDVRDESFVVPSRSGLHDELMKEERRAVNVNYDFSTSLPKNNDNSIYEPHDLSLIPERGLEKGPKNFDPAKDFDVQNGIKKEMRIQEDPLKIAKEGLKGLGKARKSSSVPYGLEKRKVEAMTIKGKSSKLNPLADAKARAEKLRAFKADIQKAKKEKEEEERRRLEALKLERRKRIAARSSSNNVQAAQTKAKIPTKHLPSSNNSSKFSDAAPTSFSPLHKLHRTNMNSPQSTLNSKQILTTYSSPNSYKVSKFCDTQPSTSSPLIKLLGRSPETAPQKMTRLYPSSLPIKKSPSISSKFGEIRPSSSSRPDSHNITKDDRLNGSRRSLTPISRLKGEIEGSIPMKRVSIPEGSRSSPLRSPVCTREPKKTSKESQLKSKPAIFPESKVRTRREPSCDDDPIVEKAVVILENKTITAPIIRDSKAMSNIHVSSPAVRVSPTMLTAGGAYKSDECKSDKKLSSYQVVEHVPESMHQKMPMAHVCSLVNSIAVGKVHEMNENPYRRASPGGFKELLKFRRQAPSSSSREFNNANSTVTAAAPKNVPTLKDLLAEDSD